MALKLYHVTFGGFQVFKTDLRSITKPGNSIKPNLSLHNTSYFITCTILESCQYYHGYVVKVNTKNGATYSDLR